MPLPRASIAALRSAGSACFTASISAGSVASRVARHLHVDRLEALEILVVRLGVEHDRTDADQLGVRLDVGFLQAGAFVLAVVDEAIHRAPIVGQFEAEDHIGFTEQRATARIL